MNDNGTLLRKVIKVIAYSLASIFAASLVLALIRNPTGGLDQWFSNATGTWKQQIGTAFSQSSILISVLGALVVAVAVAIAETIKSIVKVIVISVAAVLVFAHLAPNQSVPSLIDALTHVVGA